jgi:hypothetical protein
MPVENTPSQPRIRLRRVRFLAEQDDVLLLRRGPLLLRLTGNRSRPQNRGGKTNSKGAYDPRHPQPDSRNRKPAF